MGEWEEGTVGILEGGKMGGWKEEGGRGRWEDVRARRVGGWEDWRVERRECGKKGGWEEGRVDGGRREVNIKMGDCEEERVGRWEGG